MIQQLNTVLRLRRDNDYNYQKIGSTFIPENGEICLVDTSTSGLRIVCGDGKTPYALLSYSDTKLVKGIYNEETGKFYNGENEIIGLTTDIYLDSNTGLLYYLNGNKYQIINKVPTATDTVTGTVKLYTTIGDNMDGTMTQKAITEELSQKVEINFSELDNETLSFSY